MVSNKFELERQLYPQSIYILNIQSNLVNPNIRLHKEFGLSECSDYWESFK